MVKEYCKKNTTKIFNDIFFCCTFASNLNNY